MISFESDYNNGAHPKVIEALVRTNGEQTLTYGHDYYSIRAKHKIAEATECKDAQVYLLVGGTQTNTTVIDGVLDICEAVICCESGHIAVHESGAIERSGHKVITLPAHDGKLMAGDLCSFMEAFLADESREHVAQPGMVYISFPTELGTIYSADEINALYEACQHYSLPLFVDGARLGYGLSASHGNVTLPWLAHHCDVFYIGGTKVGALCGEAVVFTHGNAPRRFFSIVKQHGALLAKGRLAGVQFDALFTDGLYFEISDHAIAMAAKLRAVLQAQGYRFYIESPTNQQFVIIPNADVKRLEQQVEFTHWGPYDEHHTICRFVTSWATTDEQINTLKKILESS